MAKERFPQAPSKKAILDFTGCHHISLCASGKNERGIWREEAFESKAPSRTLPKTGSGFYRMPQNQLMCQWGKRELAREPFFSEKERPSRALPKKPDSGFYWISSNQLVCQWENERGIWREEAFESKAPPAPSRKPVLDFTGRRKIGLCTSGENENWRENLSFPKKKGPLALPPKKRLWILLDIVQSACVPVEQAE